MKTTEMTTTRGRDQFYPTPPSIAGKMLAGLNLRYIQSILEPSAGKGDLIDAIGRANLDLHYSHRDIDVDFCEIDPYLRQICKYNFSDEKKHELYEQYEPLQRKSFSSLTYSQQQEYKRLKREIDLIRDTKVHCVHDDFFSYRTYKRYDLILMNPPFAHGDQHLLRAIDMQQRQGGSIVCLLNAETIRNPCTASRVQLAAKLKEVNADIQFVEDAFSDDAERKADVDVAIIRIHISQPDPDESDIWKRMKKAVEEDEIPDAELHALITGDYIEMSKEMGIDMSHKSVRYPPDCIEAHNRVMKQHESVKNELDDKRFKENVEAIYEAIGNADFQKDGLCVVLPQSRTDFIMEGNALNHCVGSVSRYFENHMKGRQMIFFIRKVAKPDKPYFTMEADMTSRSILQLYGFGDSSAPSEVRKFAEQFVKAIGKGRMQVAV